MQQQSKKISSPGPTNKHPEYQAHPQKLLHWPAHSQTRNSSSGQSTQSVKQPRSKWTTANEQTIQDLFTLTNELYEQMDITITGISDKLHDLAKRSTRSCKATKTIKNLEAAISIFSPHKPTVGYNISNYATGNWCWKCSLNQDHAAIQDLLLEDICTQQDKNKQFGKKIEQIIQQAELLKQQASSIYDSQSPNHKHFD